MSCVVAACSRRSAGACVQCSAGRRGKKVRSGASQVIVRVGGAVRWCMVQARCRERWCVCLSVCLRLKLTSGRAWEERDKHGGTFDHFPRTDAAQSRAWANPHIVPAHRLTAMRLVSIHGHLTSCRSAQASVLSGLSTCVHRYATVWSLFEAPRSTCCITLNAQQSRWLRRGSRENVEQ